MLTNSVSAPKPALLEQGEAPAWDLIQSTAEAVCAAEPLLAAYVRPKILAQTPENILIGLFTSYFREDDAQQTLLRDIARKTFQQAPILTSTLADDLMAIVERDPSTDNVLQALLYRKGFHALLIHRVAHVLWRQGRRELAQYMAFVCSRTASIDIHPGARIGKSVMFDHGTGVVIGETAVIGNNVSILHNVTLGGTGKTHGDRHPKVGSGVLIGAGATLLGNIKVGDSSKVAAGSVVLDDVPAYTTVAGVPAKVVRYHAFCPPPSESMDQSI